MNVKPSNRSNVNDERIQKFFDTKTLDADPRLEGSECVDCSEVQFPETDRCRTCFGDTRKRPLSQTGELYSYATVTAGPPKYDPPYKMGYVDLPEDIRIFSKLDGDEFHIGQTVSVTIGVVGRDDQEILGYLFEPAQD
jgi:benzoylsuccinyl-CoA thiolase BbsA subunit